MIKAFFYQSRFLFLLRCALAAAFVYAGAIKVMAPLDFADSIASFQVLPPFLITITALALPPFEVILGGLLLTGKYKRQAAASIFALAIVFAIALGQALIRGLEVDCGCFGNRQPGMGSTWLSLGRDLLILIASGWVYHAFQRDILKQQGEINPRDENRPELQPNADVNNGKLASHK